MVHRGEKLMLARLYLAAVLIAALSGQAAANPSDADVQAYRQRLALYIAAGQKPEEVVDSLTRFFPWYGARFGIETDRAGAVRYYVAIGAGNGMSFFAMLN